MVAGSNIMDAIQVPNPTNQSNFLGLPLMQTIRLHLTHPGR
jgi:hypothetical protein